MSVTVLAAALALTGADPAPAMSFSESVSEAVFETCSSLIAGELSLKDPAAVKKLGFKPAGEIENPRFGKILIVSRSSADGVLAIGAGEQAFCQVQFEGKTGAAALEAIRTEVLLPENGYKLDPKNNRASDGIAIETYKKPLQPGAVTYVQLMSAKQPGPYPHLIVQLMVMEE